MQTTATLWEEIVADPRFRDLPYKVEAICPSTSQSSAGASSTSTGRTTSLG